jgi:hypothetical protein
MLRIAAPRKIGELWPSGENAMRPNMYVVSTVFLKQEFAIAGHEHRNRICQQQHSGGDGARHAIRVREAHAGIFQVDRVHQMVEGDVAVAAAEPGEERSHESGESIERIASEGAEQQIKPDHVGLKLVECPEEPHGRRGVVERPATQDGKTIQFGERR